MHSIKETIAKEMQGRYEVGDHFRIRHDECTSRDKEPACNVTRSLNGWAWFCHRCGKGGFIPDRSQSPNQTVDKVKKLHSGPPNKVTENVTLPLDFTESIPNDGLRWLWANGVVYNQEDGGTQSDLVLKYNIGWSDRYNRVIIPLYEYARMGDDLARKLVGWVGREVTCKTKEERKEKKITKYLKRAKKGKRRHFVAPGEEDTIVIVEDCVSAMLVREATGYTAVALLNTTVGDNLMRWLRGKKVYLWLDGDMLASGVQQVNRMRSLGLDAYHIYTTKDPKKYDADTIKETLKAKSGVKSDV